MKNKGFAITGIIYGMFLLFVVVLLGNLSTQIMIKKNNEYKGETTNVVKPAPVVAEDHPILPATLYFRSDRILGATNIATSATIEYGPSSTPFTSYISMRVLHKTNSGDIPISAWRQAQVDIPQRSGEHYYGMILRTITYDFPGWSNGELTDRLVIEVGISNNNTINSAPNGTIRRFETEPLNTTTLNPHTFTFNYYAYTRGEDDGSFNITYYSGWWYGAIYTGDTNKLTSYITTASTI